MVRSDTSGKTNSQQIIKDYSEKFMEYKEDIRCIKRQTQIRIEELKTKISECKCGIQNERGKMKESHHWEQICVWKNKFKRINRIPNVMRFIHKTGLKWTKM